MIAFLIALLAAPDWTMDVSEVAQLTVKYEHDDVTILRIERQTLPKATHLQRWRGRFEARASDGKKQLEFVRFDFPLLADADASEDITLEAAELGRKLREHVTATTIVKVPLPPGAQSVTIYDTATKKSVTRSLTAASPAPPPAAAAGTRK